MLNTLISVALSKRRLPWELLLMYEVEEGCVMVSVLNGPLLLDPQVIAVVVILILILFELFVVSSCKLRGNELGYVRRELACVKVY